MAKIDKLDTIITNVGEVKSNQDKLWQALKTIAERLGFSLSDEGNYFMESDNTDIPKLGLQSGDQAVSTPATTQTMDVDTFANAVLEKFKENPPKVDLGKQTVPIDTKSLLEGNKHLFETVTQPWNNWFIKFHKALLKLNGYKEVKVGDDIILAVDDNPQIPANPFKDDSPIEPTAKPKSNVKRSKFGYFLHRIWLDIISCFWKTFAYYIASLAIAFGTFLWWEQKQRADELDKRVQIFRYALEADSGGYEFLQANDRNIEEYGLDYVLDYYKKRVQEVRQKRLRDKTK